MGVCEGHHIVMYYLVYCCWWWWWSSSCSCCFALEIVVVITSLLLLLLVLLLQKRGDVNPFNNVQMLGKHELVLLGDGTIVFGSQRTCRKDYRIRSSS